MKFMKCTKNIVKSMSQLLHNLNTECDTIGNQKHYVLTATKAKIQTDTISIDVSELKKELKIFKDGSKANRDHDNDWIALSTKEAYSRILSAKTMTLKTPRLIDKLKSLHHELRAWRHIAYMSLRMHGYIKIV